LMQVSQGGRVIEKRKIGAETQPEVQKGFLRGKRGLCGEKEIWRKTGREELTTKGIEACGF